MDVKRAQELTKYAREKQIKKIMAHDGVFSQLCHKVDDEIDQAAKAGKNRITIYSETVIMWLDNIGLKYDTKDVNGIYILIWNLALSKHYKARGFFTFADSHDLMLNWGNGEG